MTEPEQLVSPEWFQGEPELEGDPEEARPELERRLAELEEVWPLEPGDPQREPVALEIVAIRHCLAYLEDQ